MESMEKKPDLTIDQLSYAVIGCAYTVHDELGPGLLESVYQKCLAHELRKNDFYIEVEKPISITYDGIDMGHAFRIDILVENRLILELKVADKIHPRHQAQMLSYLKFTDCKNGLILNFMEKKLKFGIKSMIL